MSRKRSSASEKTIAGTNSKRIRRSGTPEDESDNFESSSSSSSQSLSGVVAMNRQNEAIRSGKIKKINLRNFMCHSNFSIDLNRNVNLLVGSNGSGKSAVLTALVIGLGSKALAASRSTNIKQLIKRGESSATIEIHIENSGSDSYDRDEYGDVIIISRHINASGGSAYKIKNSSGRIVSTSRNDVMKILLYLNIQVDNPVCVLNQEAARNFLKDSDPKKRYKLFAKATQIETILEKLNDCDLPFKNATNQLRSQKKMLLTLRKEVEELKVKYDQLTSIETSKGTLKTLKCKQLWLRVIAEEKFLHDQNVTIETNERALQDIREKFQSKDETEILIRSKINQILEKINVIKEDIEQIMRIHEECRQAYLEKNTIYTDGVRMVKKEQAKLKKIREDILQLEKSIAERSESLESTVNRQRESNNAKITKFTHEKQNIDAMLQNATRDIELHTNTKTEYLEKYNTLNEQKMPFKEKLRKIELQIHEINTSTKDNLSVYGNYMPRLIAAIHTLYERGKFSELPRGPLGQYIHVSESKWRAPVENVIGGYLRSFCVNNGSDRAVLTQLMKKHFPEAAKSSIITTRFITKLYDVSPGQVETIHNSYRVMDLIKVDDPVIMNILIDQCKIETILFVEDFDLAVRLTENEENVPRNLLRVILTEPYTTLYPAPNYRSYTLDKVPVKFLQVDVAQKIAQLKNESAGLNEKQNQLIIEINDLKQKLLDITSMLKVKNQQKAKLEDSLNILVGNINELKSIEYPSSEDLEILNQELIELQNLSKSTAEKLEENIARTDVLKTNLEIKEAEIIDLKAQVTAKEKEIHKEQKEHDKYQQNINELQSDSRCRNNQIKYIDDVLKELYACRTKSEEKVIRLIGTAEKSGERIETDETDESITEQIRDLERKIIKVTSSNDRIEDVEILYDTKRKELSQNEALILTLTNTLKLMHKSRKERYFALMRLKQHMGIFVQHYFNEVLALRNFSGEIIIDYTLETLELSIIPRDNDIENAVSSTKCLSGGERSYSTIAFLISLWSCVDHPFYFLDEYDVFTDLVNRMYITKLLLREAETKPWRQYTFLTPQDMSSIVAKPNITIHSLEEPERHV